MKGSGRRKRQSLPQAPLGVPRETDSDTAVHPRLGGHAPAGAVRAYLHGWCQLWASSATQFQYSCSRPLNLCPRWPSYGYINTFVHSTHIWQLPSPEL